MPQRVGEVSNIAKITLQYFGYEDDARTGPRLRSSRLTWSRSPRRPEKLERCKIALKTVAAVFEVIGEGAASVHAVVHPLASVDGAVGERVGALTVPLVVLPLADVLGPILPRVDAVAMPFVAIPLSIVLGAISPSEDAVAVRARMRKSLTSHNIT